MKTFDTFEKVEDMLCCKKKPITVQCKQIDEEFRVNTLEGDYKQGKPGDYLIKGIDGELYICDQEIFEKTYDILWGEIYEEVNLKELQDLIDTIYQGYSCVGGALHIVLDDFNIRDDHIQWCLDNSIAELTDKTEKEIYERVAKILLSMTLEERYNFLEGHY